MNISDIPAIAVSYNTPGLVKTLLETFRAHYTNKFYIIDGSNQENAQQIGLVCQQFDNVEFIHFDYNIHHGPGMAWAFQNLPLSGPVLVIDSDVVVVRGGFIESMLAELKPGDYGVGNVYPVNEEGFDMPDDAVGIHYLHPACMLCNIEVVRQWPMPIRHGAPMFPTMKAIHNAGKSHLLKSLVWLKQDFKEDKEKHYLIHDWQGTVKVNSSYELDDWINFARKRKTINDLLLAMVPEGTKKIVEIGENDGLLARASKETSPHRTFIAYQHAGARVHHVKSLCDEAITFDLDAVSKEQLSQHLNQQLSKHQDAECWILDNALERLHKPEMLMQALRQTMNPDARLLLVIPNAQNWPRLLSTANGHVGANASDPVQPEDVQYYSLEVINELLHKSGFALASGASTPVDTRPNQESESALKSLLLSIGIDADTALQRLMIERFVIQAVPIKPA
jgi:hypothetical protein